MRSLVGALVVMSIAIAVAACGDSSDEPVASRSTEISDTSDEVTNEATGDGLFPDVLDAVLTANGDGTFDVNVTLSSPYDSPERYADAWRVLDRDGNELGIRILTHDHANEQPFTRSLSGVGIGPDIETVTIEGRDQVNGWGGSTFDVAVPHG